MTTKACEDFAYINKRMQDPDKDKEPLQPYNPNKPMHTSDETDYASINRRLMTLATERWSASGFNAYTMSKKPQLERLGPGPVKPT